ncbi:MAG: GFA family protein [Alphaproteobacteria bacterium]
MEIDGGCHCGAITYRAEVDPADASLCHCTDCQTLSGAPFRSMIYTAAERFELLSGHPKIYIRTAESGAKRVQAFCPDCGTPLYATAAEPGPGPRKIGIRLGTVRQRAALKPRRQFWARSALPWIGDLASIPKIEKQ